MRSDLEEALILSFKSVYKEKLKSSLKSFKRSSKTLFLGL
ncbi:hypothetical protein [Helicobacter pylori]